MRARGFSIIECAFALVLLSGGLLAVAVTARASNRMARLARLGSGATNAALSRMALLESRPCVAASGTAVSSPYSETWTVAAARGLRRINLSVTAAHEGRTLSWTFAAAVLCRGELP